MQYPQNAAAACSHNVCHRCEHLRPYNIGKPKDSKMLADFSEWSHIHNGRYNTVVLPAGQVVHCVQRLLAAT